MQMVRQDDRSDSLERSCFLYVFPGRTEIRDVIDEQAALAVLQVQREEICSARNVEPSIIWQSIPPAHQVGRIWRVSLTLNPPYGAFDFSNQNHREAIGRALVDKHRNEHFSVD